MEAIVGILNNPIVLTVVQVAFGFAIKKLPALADWPNKLIPLFNALLAVVVKLAVPAEAHADTIAVAAVVGLKLGWLKAVVVEAVGQTLVSTGVHSSLKNLWQQLVIASVRGR